LGNQNGGLVQDAVIFRKKIDFSLSGSCHRKLSFFSICKSQFIVHRPKMYQKFCQEKKNQDGGDFQDGVYTL
jgi:hypothetical protein